MGIRGFLETEAEVPGFQKQGLEFGVLDLVAAVELLANQFAVEQDGQLTGTQPLGLLQRQNNLADQLVNEAIDQALS